MAIKDFFKKKEFSAAPVKTERAEIIGGLNSSFSAYSGDSYNNDIYRGAVDAIARNAGKLKGSHVIKNADHDRIDRDCKINRVLQVQPNPFMNAFDFLYKLITHYYLYNNAFALIERDKRGNLAAVYPLNSSHMDFMSDLTGVLYCKFYFEAGRELTIPYNEVIHLRRNFNSKVLLGDDNDAVLPAVELAHTQNEGITSGIKSSANIRGILKIDKILNSAALKDERDDFMRDYMDMSNNGGVVVVDNKMDYTPVDLNPIILDAEQSKEVKGKIYNYMGITESIVNSSYTEDEWAAFYESIIEPLALQLGLEFTRKLFNDREQAFGNSIIFESGRLQFSSNTTKVQLIKELMPMGLLSINQALEILNLPSVEGGEKRLQTLNVVDADKANEYQLNQEELK